MMKRSKYVDCGFLRAWKSTQKTRKKTESSTRRKLGFVFLICCSFHAADTLAQTGDAVRNPYTFRNDVFVGGNYTRAASGQSLDQTNFGGWSASITHYLSPIWGATLDVQGAYGHAPLNSASGASLDPFVSKYIFLAGPQIRWRRRERYSSSIRLLAGVTDSIYDSDTGGASPATVGLYSNATKLAFKPGGVFDYNLSPRIAVRIAPGVLLERQGGSFQRDVNVSTGILFRLGKQER